MSGNVGVLLKFTMYCIGMESIVKIVFKMPRRRIAGGKYNLRKKASSEEKKKQPGLFRSVHV